MKRLVPALCALVLMGGCASRHAGPYQSTAAERRDVAKAETLYKEALPQLAKDSEKAEAILREALSWDLYHGGAHNNLGVLLLKQDRLYDAAEEFEWARKLLPGNPEPRVNLALTLDRAGRTADALDAVRTALEVRPGHMPAVQLAALLQMREGASDATTAGLLDQISSRADDPAWRTWAIAQRDRLAATNAR